MDIDFYINEWEKDSKIDQTELGSEALEIPKLHHKYYSFLIKENRILDIRKSELKVLELEKNEFYSQGHNEETIKKGWVLPAKGMLLKTEIPRYVEADPDIINLSLKIGIQKEKVDFIKDILDNIKYRNNSIKNAIEWQKFISGA